VISVFFSLFLDHVMGYFSSCSQSAALIASQTLPCCWPSNHQSQSGSLCAGYLHELSRLGSLSLSRALCTASVSCHCSSHSHAQSVGDSYHE